MTTELFSLIPELNRPNVRVKDAANLTRLLNNMIRMGTDYLQVVSDFDRTISLISSPTSNGILQNSSLVSDEHKKQFAEWFDHYYPIEHCHVMSREEKTPHMIDWWNKTNDLLVRCGITKSSLRACVEKAVTHLRADCKSFFASLENAQVPLLIFSAGLGDIIAEWIEHECGRLYANMKIVSNFMVFDETTTSEQKLVGFTEPMIHIFNKNESVLMGSAFEREIEKRPNVMLLGDSLGDVDMAGRGPGFHGRIDNLLKIGFLNTKVDEFIDIYMDNFDVVLIKDDTFDIPNAILRAILKN